MNTCKGCQRQESCVIVKIEERSNIQYKALCPCKDCILKMMCREDCKDYIKIVRRAFIDYDNLRHPDKRTTKIKRKTIYINHKVLEYLKP